MQKGLRTYQGNYFLHPTQQLIGNFSIYSGTRKFCLRCAIRKDFSLVLVVIDFCSWLFFSFTSLQSSNIKTVKNSMKNYSQSKQTSYAENGFEYFSPNREKQEINVTLPNRFMTSWNFYHKFSLHCLRFPFHDGTKCGPERVESINRIVLLEVYVSFESNELFSN